MKKFIFKTLLITILLTNINVYATSSNTTDEIIPINNNDGQLIGIKYIVNIPNDYNEEEIIIVPKIFDFINNYKHLIPNEEIKIDIEINNKSNNNYSYIDNSFIITTDDLSKNGISNNLNIIGKGFDNKNIYNNFQIYRTYNEAIKYLYDQDEFIDDYLSNESIDCKLKYYGYSGINELDKFYIDYYNNKYNLKEKDLNDFTYSVKKEIFDGNISTYKENNTKINELAYNYFYNKLMYFRFSKDIVDDFNTHEYSIGKHIKDNIGNDYFKNIMIFKNSSYNIKNMNLGINKYYYSETFNDYGLYLYMEFKLKKNNDYIIPPNTGV